MAHGVELGWASGQQQARVTGIARLGPKDYHYRAHRRDATLSPNNHGGKPNFSRLLRTLPTCVSPRFLYS